MSNRPAPSGAVDVAETVKCLVWDLDDTLWRGILLEDGRVELSEDVRGVLRTLDARGILHSVASRNDHDDAWMQLERLGIAEYFVVPQIGWGRKSDAVREIARQLGFAYRTIAFIDDQPAECAEVAYRLPEVRCYAAGDAVRLVELPEFSPRVVTVDTRRRREMYRAASRRDAARAGSSSTDEQFLRSLELVMRVGPATEEELARVEELTLRTSQMNATGVHYPHAVLRGLLADLRHDVLVASMTDRFGPHGAVGVVLLSRHEAVWHLKLLATSCRVVSFGAGAVLLRWLVEQSARAGVHLVADFRRTDRNRIMEITYRFAGFGEQPCPCVAALPAPVDGIQRLHLAPARQQPPVTMRVVAPTPGDSQPREWS